VKGYKEHNLIAHQVTSGASKLTIVTKKINKMDYLIARPVTCANTMQYCPVKPLHHLVKISSYKVAFVSVNKYRN
jgi:hypothetical protein